MSAAENLSGQIGTVAVNVQREPTQNADPQPAPAAQLIDRVYELARDWNLDGVVGRIERALEVRLSGDESRMSLATAMRSGAMPDGREESRYATYARPMRYAAASSNSEGYRARTSYALKMVGRMVIALKSPSRWSCRQKERCR